MTTTSSQHRARLRAAIRNLSYELAALPPIVEPHDRITQLRTDLREALPADAAAVLREALGVAPAALTTTEAA
jgi:hypothetical protein